MIHHDVASGALLLVTLRDSQPLTFKDWDKQMHPFSETQKEYLREGLPTFRAGDTLRVNVRVREGDA